MKQKKDQKLKQIICRRCEHVIRLPEDGNPPEKCPHCGYRGGMEMHERKACPKCGNAAMELGIKMNAPGIKIG